MALTSPIIRSSLPSTVTLYIVTSIIPFLMVSPTLAPSNTAPHVSNMDARIHAFIFHEFKDL